MNHLISAIDSTVKLKQPLPFSIYRSIKEQHLLSVPIAKPLFIAVLSGNKELGKTADVVCNAGDFIFLSDSSVIDMRNIPQRKSILRY
jgi:hypothetical protein